MRERTVYLRRFRRLAWSQNEAARQAGKAPGLFSRWMRGEFSSAPIRLAIDSVLAEREAERLAEQSSELTMAGNGRA